jgi:hypothetical protein
MLAAASLEGVTLATCDDAGDDAGDGEWDLGDDDDVAAVAAGIRARSVTTAEAMTATVRAVVATARPLPQPVDHFSFRSPGASGLESPPAPQGLPAAGAAT